MGDHGVYVCFRRNTALGDDRYIGWNLWQQIECVVQRCTECFQVSVVYADERGVSASATLSSCWSCTSMRTSSQCRSRYRKVFQFCGRQCAHDKQHAVSTHQASFNNLVWIDGEIFANYG